MKLEIIYDGNSNIVDITNVNDLKDYLFEYSGYFIPEDDELAIELLQRNEFDDLINELETYFVKSFFEIAKDYFLTLKRIYSYKTIDEVKNEINKLNELYDKGGLGLKYIIK